MSGSRPSTSSQPELGAVLRCENVWKIFRAGDGVVKALKDVSLAVWAGEMVCLRGPSGSGKTTLLNLLGALDFATTGEVFAFGLRYKDLSSYELSRLRKNFIGFVFQELSLISHLTALENVLIPCLFDGRPRVEIEKAGFALLQKVEAAHRSSHFPRQLSSGERQRVAIARALMRDPKALLADEPTANLDNANVEKVLAIFRNLCAQGVAIIVATHDDRIQKAADRVVWINDGVLQESA